MATKKNRKAERAEVALIARYRSPTAFEFVAEDCADLSAGGMFIRSPKPAPPGTLLKLECDVGDGKATIRAVARVVWLREQETAGGPTGMGVKFVKLEPGSKEVIQAVLENPELRQSLIPGSRVLSQAALEDGAIRSSVPPAADRASALAPSSPPPSAAASAFGAERQSRPVEETDAESFGFDADTPPTAHEPAVASEPAAAVEPVLATSSTSEGEPVAAAATSLASEPPAPAEVSAAAAPSTPPEPIRSELPSVSEPSSVHVVRRKSGAEGLRERLKQSKLFDDLQRRPSTAPPAAAEPAPAFGADASAPAPAYPEHTEAAASYTAPGHSQAEPAPKVERVVGAERLFIPTAGDAEAAAADERLDSLPPDVPARERVSKRTKIIIAAVAGWGVLIAVFATRDVAPNEEAGEPPAAEAAKPPAPPAPSPPPAPEPLPVEPVPGLTPTEAVQPAEAVEAEPASPSALPVEYVLDVVTIPAGARVSAGGQTVTTPGQLRLGLLEAPVQIAASKQGFVRVVSTIDRREFQLQGDEMRGTLTLALVEEGASSSSKPAPAPAPTPPPERPRAVARPRPPEPTPVPPPASEPAPASDGVRTAIGTTKVPKGSAEPKAGPSPMETALACLSRGDNECVITALDGKANTARELELLIETYRATGRSAKAETLMENYVRRFPEQRRAQSYQRMLDTQ